MNDMRKLMEAVLLETPLRVGDIVGYKNKSYEVVGINPNDFDQVLIKSQTSDAEGWVDDSKLSRNPQVAESTNDKSGAALKKGDIIVHATKGSSGKIIKIESDGKVSVKWKFSGSTSTVNPNTIVKSGSQNKRKSKTNEVVESDDIDIDTFLEDLEISIKNIISK